jgi:hypothetical protein
MVRCHDSPTTHDLRIVRPESERRGQAICLLTERKILQPFDKRECFSLKEAADIAGMVGCSMAALPPASWFCDKIFPEATKYFPSDEIVTAFRKSVSYTLRCNGL